MKTLIVYFSHTGENWMKNGLEIISKGNTEIVAEKVQKLTNGKLFKVEEVKSYSTGYHACCDEAKAELQANARPKIKKNIENIDEFEQIIICSPIWWSHLPMALFTALKPLNFAGKNVKFIVTHEGSGLGDIPSDINSLCQNANISKGLAIRGHKASVCDKDLENYLKN